MKTGYNQVCIIVQDADEGASAFSTRLNEWLKKHEYMPILINATASSNGRQTLNFLWFVPIENK